MLGRVGLGDLRSQGWKNQAPPEKKAETRGFVLASCSLSSEKSPNPYLVCRLNGSPCRRLRKRTRNSTASLWSGAPRRPQPGCERAGGRMKHEICELKVPARAGLKSNAAKSEPRVVGFYQLRLGAQGLPARLLDFRCGIQKPKQEARGSAKVPRISGVPVARLNPKPQALSQDKKKKPPEASQALDPTPSKRRRSHIQCPSKLLPEPS